MRRFLFKFLEMLLSGYGASPIFLFFFAVVLGGLFVSIDQGIRAGFPRFHRSYRVFSIILFVPILLLTFWALMSDDIGGPPVEILSYYIPAAIFAAIVFFLYCLLQKPTGDDPLNIREKLK